MCVRACAVDSYYSGNSFLTYHCLLTVISRLMKNQNSSESTKCDSGLEIDQVRLQGPQLSDIILTHSFVFLWYTKEDNLVCHLLAGLRV